MKYIGNIEKLRNSIFVKKKKPVLKITPKFKKIIGIIKIKYSSSSVKYSDLMKEYNLSELKAKYAISELKKYKLSLVKEEVTLIKDSTDNIVIDLHNKLCHIKNQYADELRIHGEQTSIKEGFIYLITNPSWDGWIKAGMTIDYQSRIMTYNINDPFGNYNFICLKWVDNRRDAENILLETLNKHSSTSKGEWFQINQSSASKIFYDL